ncbi:hypothetical protein ACFQZ4_11800 [Catellatospora coxensis]
MISESLTRSIGKCESLMLVGSPLMNRTRRRATTVSPAAMPSRCARSGAACTSDTSIAWCGVRPSATICCENRSISGVAGRGRDFSCGR